MDIIVLWLRTYFVYVSIFIVYYWIVEFYTWRRKENIGLLTYYTAIFTLLLFNVNMYRIFFIHINIGLAVNCVPFCQNRFKMAIITAAVFFYLLSWTTVTFMVMANTLNSSTCMIRNFLQAMHILNYICIFLFCKSIARKVTCAHLTFWNEILPAQLRR